MFLDSLRSDIAEPIRHIFRKQDNAQVLLDEVAGIDLDAGDRLDGVGRTGTVAE